MAEQPVRVERHGDGTATITVNRPEARNALNIATRSLLADICNTLAGDDSVRAIVLTGGPEVFVAGADISEMAATDAITMYQRKTEKWWQAVADVPQPMIAAINGYALGGGLELAMCCDIIIAGENAMMGQPEVRVGILPGAGGTQRLTRAIGKFNAMRLVLTGDMVTGTEAARMGLASLAVKDEEVYATALKMAQKIARLPAIAVQQAKETVLLGADASLPAALALERKALQLTFASQDKREGMAAFLEKRRPEFKGK